MSIPGIAYMEVVRGQMLFENAAEQTEQRTRVSSAGVPQSRTGVQAIKSAFDELPVFWPSERAQAKALRRMTKLYPTNQVEIPDFLIAYTAIERDMLLLTRDRDYRHFEDDGLRWEVPFGSSSPTSRPEEGLDV